MQCNYKLTIHKKQISFLETLFAQDAMILQKKKQQDKVPRQLTRFIIFQKYFSSRVTRHVVTSSKVNFMLSHIIRTFQIVHSQFDQVSLLLALETTESETQLAHQIALEFMNNHLISLLHKGQEQKLHSFSCNNHNK